MLDGSSIATPSHSEPLLVLFRWPWQGSLFSGGRTTKLKGPMPVLCLHLLALFEYAAGVEHMECEIKLEGPVSPDVEPGKEETEESKKRKRKPYRPGEALGWAVGWGGVGSPSPQRLLSLSSASS